MQFSFISSVKRWKELAQQFSSVGHAQIHSGMGIWGSKTVRKIDKEVISSYFFDVLHLYHHSIACLDAVHPGP